MYPYDENNNSTNTPETGSERPAEDGSYRIVKPDAEREACYRDASYTPQGEASFDGYYVPGGRGPKPPEPEKKPHKRGIGAAGVIALCSSARCWAESPAASSPTPTGPTRPSSATSLPPSL